MFRTKGPVRTSFPSCTRCLRFRAASPASSAFFRHVTPPPDSWCQRLHRQLPDPGGAGADGLGSVRDGPRQPQARRLPRPSPLPFSRGRHHPPSRVDRLPREAMRRGDAARRNREPDPVRPRSPAGLRTRFRGEPGRRAPVRPPSQAVDLSLHLRGLRDVPGCGARRGGEPAGVRPDRAPAVDLRRLEATARPGDLRVRRARGDRLHPVPALQLDRPPASTR
jgi:hypothetical protein